MKIVQVFRLGSTYSILSNGLVCVGVSISPYDFLLKACTVYGVKWSSRVVTVVFFSFKKYIFGRLAAIFGSKFAAKLKFSQNRRRFTSSMAQKYFEAYNGSTRGILRGVPNITGIVNFELFDIFWEMWSYSRSGVLAIYQQFLGLFML